MKHLSIGYHLSFAHVHGGPNAEESANGYVNLSVGLLAPSILNCRSSCFNEVRE